MRDAGHLDGWRHGCGKAELAAHGVAWRKDALRALPPGSWFIPYKWHRCGCRDRAVIPSRAVHFLPLPPLHTPHGLNLLGLLGFPAPQPPARPSPALPLPLPQSPGSAGRTEGGWVDMMGPSPFLQSVLQPRHIWFCTRQRLLGSFSCPGYGKC